jgi:uncharacterized membrane protein YeiH
LILDNFVEYSSYIGVIAYAVSGAIIAIHKKLDLLGIFFLSLVNTMGGGVIRDLLVIEIPNLLKDPLYAYLIISSVSLLLAFRLYKINAPLGGKIYVFCDAVGLSSFSIIGGLIAIDNNLNFFSIILFSIITAIGGSVIRDILLNEIPRVFKEDFYAAISLILGVVLFILQYFAILTALNISILLCFGVILRLIAYWRKWNLSIIDDIVNI